MSMHTEKNESGISWTVQKELNQNKYDLHITQSKKIYKFLRSKNILIKEIIFAEEFKLYKSNVHTFQKVTTIHHSKKLVGRHPTPLCIKASPSTMVNCFDKYSPVHSREWLFLGKANRRSPEPSSSLHFFLFQDIFVTNVSKKNVTRNPIKTEKRNVQYRI